MKKEELLFLDKNGYIIIPNVLNQEERLQGISELWDILENVPNKPKYKIKRPYNPLGKYII